MKERKINMEKEIISFADIFISQNLEKSTTNLDILLSKINSNELTSSIYKNIYTYSKPVVIECLLDYYQHLKEKKTLSQNTRTKRLEAFYNILQQDEELREFKNSFPLLESKIRNKINNILFMYHNVLKKFIDDYDMIYNNFQLDQSVYLVNISLPKGDIHHGEAVLSLEFSDHQSIMYKPRSFTPELLLKDIISVISPNLNRKLSFKFPTLLNKEKYGWQERIIAKECENWNEVHNFYYRIGVYLSIFYLLNTNDLHFENMIACGEFPIFFDLETLVTAHARGDSTQQMYIPPFDVLNTGILPMRNTDGIFDVNLSAIFTGKTTSKTIKDLTIQEHEELDWIYVSKFVTTNAQDNICKYNGYEPAFWIVEKDILQGFKDGIQSIIKSKTNLFDLFLSPYLSTLKIRQLLRPTYIYAKFIQALESPEAIKSKEKTQEILEILLDNFKLGKHGYLRVEEEVKQLDSDNIPSFYNFYSSRNLYSGDNLICNDYFYKSPKEIINDNLTFINKKDIQRQLRLMKLSLLSLQDRDELITCFNRFELEHIPSDKKAILNEAKHYIENLSNCFITLPDSTAYLQFPYMTNSGFGTVIPKEEFYQYGGLLLLLTMYSVYINKDYSNLTKKSLDYLITKYINKKKINDAELNYSFFYGISSVLYLIYIFYKHFNESSYIEYINEISNDILDYYNEAILNFDYMEGVPSVLFLLIQIYNDSKNKFINKNKLFNLINRIKKEINKIDLSNYDCSVSHGLGGILLCLGAIYSVAPEENTKKTIFNIIKIINGNKTESSSWCQGLTGLLGVNHYLKKVSQNKIYIFKDSDEIIRKIITTAGKEKIDLCLCHGLAGTLITLKKSINVQSDTYKEYVNLFNNSTFNFNNLSWFKHSSASLESFMMGSSGLIYSYINNFYNLPNPLFLEV